jgi:hypothetical protein
VSTAGARLGELAVRCDHVGGEDVIGDEPLALGVEFGCEFVEASTGPWRQWRVVVRADCGTCGRPRRRRRGRRLAEVAEGRPRESGEREHGRLPPQDFRGRDGCHRHRLDLDVSARLIGVDFQEHVADPQGRALAMGDDNLDLLHIRHHREDDRSVAGLNHVLMRPDADVDTPRQSPTSHAARSQNLRRRAESRSTDRQLWDHAAATPQRASMSLEHRSAVRCAVRAATSAAPPHHPSDIAILTDQRFLARAPVQHMDRRARPVFSR